MRNVLLSLVVLALPALPVLYVLSIGPAAWATSAGMLNYDVYWVVYSPIIEFSYQPGCEELREWLNWYGDWWLRLPNS